VTYDPTVVPAGLPAPEDDGERTIGATEVLAWLRGLSASRS
jgi:hypothetical protein